jgi:hypothetical protein
MNSPFANTIKLLRADGFFRYEMIVDWVAIDKGRERLNLVARECTITSYFAQREAIRKVALMPPESARRAPMLSLQELYRLYTTLAPKPGESVPLSAFKFSAEQTEKLFSIFDEDYHISRFFHFSVTSGDKYSINGEVATHVAIDPEISSIL